MKIKGIGLILILLLCCGLAGCKKENSSVAASFIAEKEISAQAPTTEQVSSDNVLSPTTEQNNEIIENVVTEIHISAVGDITLGTNQSQSYKNSFHDYYDRYGAEYFMKEVKHIFEADDLTIGNLEGTLTTATERMDKLWNHKGKPEYINVLTSASFEALTLGNNHIMDYGQKGIDETIDVLAQAGIKSGMSNIYGNFYGVYNVKDIKIGFVSVNEHYEFEGAYVYLDRGYDELLAMGCDYIIALPHWGMDFDYDVDEKEKIMGRWCIDKGYDIVLGGHPHVLQEIELYNGKYIVYCMGNFCYGGNKNPKDKNSMIVQLDVTFTNNEPTDLDMTIIPCRLSSVTTKNDYKPIILKGKEANDIIDKLNNVSNTVVIDYNGKVNEKNIDE